MLELLGPIPVRYVSHEELKRMTAGTKGVIRTGECTPYANVILVAARVF